MLTWKPIDQTAFLPNCKARPTIELTSWLCCEHQIRDSVDTASKQCSRASEIARSAKSEFESQNPCFKKQGMLVYAILIIVIMLIIWHFHTSIQLILKTLSPTVFLSPPHSNQYSLSKLVPFPDAQVLGFCCDLFFSKQDHLSDHWIACVHCSLMA